MPDETTILRLRRLREKQELAPQAQATINAWITQHGLMLKTATVVDALISGAQSSTKGKQGERDPEMHQTEKGRQWNFGMKAHIGLSAASGLMHTVIGTATDLNGLTQAGTLQHGQKRAAFGDAGFRGVDKCQETQSPTWFFAMQLRKRKPLNPTSKSALWLQWAEQIKAGVTAKLDHPFRVVKHQFRYAKVRYGGLATNTAQQEWRFLRRASCG